MTDPDSSFELRVDSIFHMPGQGSVLAGRVIRGAVCVGERVSVSSPSQSVAATIAGLERPGDHEFVAEARAGDEVAILMHHIDFDRLADGVEKIVREGSIEMKPTSLTVTKKKRPWWKLF